MRWLTNIVDPKREDAPQLVPVRTEQTQEEAWEEFLDWLRAPPPNEKCQGPPKATEKYSVAELQAMGTVDVYLVEEGDGIYKIGP